MADATKKTFEIVHIVYILVAVLVAVGIAYGTVTNQQKNDRKEIESKLSKDVFEVHQQEQRIATDRLMKSLDNGFERLEKRIEGK